MSSNNQIVIIEKKRKFEIHENSCVDNPFKPDKESLLKIEDDLEKAIKYADKYCNEYPPVEYGYAVQFEKKSQKRKKIKKVKKKILK